MCNRHNVINVKPLLIGMANLNAVMYTKACEQCIDAKS